MNRKLYSLLCDNYNKPKSEEHYQMLKEIFDDEDPIMLERAFNKIINEDKYFPSVVRIKEILDEVWKKPLTKEEKLKRWEKEGIIPSCLSKTPKDEEIDDEELKALQEDFDLLFG